MTGVPTFDAIMNPLIHALKNLGGSGTIEEMENDVIFQCKRYIGSVGTGVVRDFRGAMVGRADKGLLITIGNFTRDAEREATRDGAPAIDLIDGEGLADKLKELSLGVETSEVTTEKVEIDRDWFLSI